jgi:hypothetical protein
MPVRLARERLIRRVWSERGKALWEAWKTPGPLVLDVTSPIVNLPTSLTFELRRSTVKGKTVDVIVCDGVIVETLNART